MDSLKSLIKVMKEVGTEPKPPFFSLGEKWWFFDMKLISITAALSTGVDGACSLSRHAILCRSRPSIPINFIKYPFLIKGLRLF